MAKRWTEQEDRFIHACFEAMGDAIGPRDLGRPKGAVTKRAKLLRDSGAWTALDEEIIARRKYIDAVFPGEAAMRAEFWDGP